MKKKILVALLILAIAVSVIFAFTLGAGAETAEPALKIGGKTLVMENSIYIRYLVSATNVESINDVSLLVWSGSQDEYVKGEEEYEVKWIKGTTKNAGVTYYHFDFTGVAAKMLADDFYAVAYTKVGDKEYYSEPHKYSVLKYAYNMMGKLDKAATTVENLIPLLDTMLDYGATAQTYFKYKADRLASDDFYQVKTVGGKLADGFTDGLYLTGDKLAITADAPTEGFEFVGWQQNSTGEIVSADMTATVEVGSANETYTALYGEIETCTVSFVDYNGDVLKTATVEKGKGATAPAVPEREGYIFTGWDKSFTGVTEDIVVIAQYEKVITDPTIVVESVVASIADETVSVKISIANNPGISSLKLYVSYGTELELESVTFDSAFGTYATAAEPYKNPQAITLLSPFADIDANGTVATLTFKIADFITVDTVANVNVTVAEAFNADSETVEFDVVNGKVNIKAEGNESIILPPDIIG